jgi:hypothetical protein
MGMWAVPNAKVVMLINTRPGMNRSIKV